ncbi:thyroid adenoma-associated protein homolog isoform X2 [Daktulosphaira vitifoliae]|nr:thyroid adenoma-associated protein homolog isoform X2 [Daktulosphaira vitifoliae]
MLSNINDCILIKIIKHVSDVCYSNSLNNEEAIVIFFKFLVKLHIEYCPNESVKKTIIKCFKLCPDEKQATLRTLFSSDLIKIMEREHNFSEAEFLFKTLSNCCEQFPEIILQCTKKIIIFLEFHLQKAYYCLSGDESSPVTKISAIRCIHETFRFFLNFFKRNLINTSLSPSLNEYFVKLQYSNYLPMETLFNCTLSIVSFHLTSMTPLEFWKVCQKNILSEPDFIKLSLCVSILNTFSWQDLILVENYSEKSLFSYLFDIIVKIYKRSSNDSSIILSTSRVVFIISKRLSNCCKIQIEKIELEFLIDFVWDHLDHYIDGVRHLARDTLLNIIKIKDEYVLEKILCSLSACNRNSKAFIVVLTLLADKKISEDIIKYLPCVSNELLSLMSSSNSAIHVFLSLMTDNLTNTEFELWFNYWIQPLFHCADTLDVKYIEQILKNAVQLSPNISKKFIKMKDENKFFLKISLICFKIEKQINSQNIECINWIDMITVETMKKALHNNDNEIRIIAVNLILDSHKTTKSFLKEELELMKYFIIYNVKTEEASIRQINLSLVKKLILRMKESQYSAVVRSDKILEKSVEQNYTQFHHWLITFCFENLFFDENFARRYFVLEVLNLISTFLSLNETKKQMFKDTKNICLLLNCIWDTHEQNKLLAVKILKSKSLEKINLPSEISIEDIFNIIKVLVSSINPSDCITAAYLLEVMIYLSNKNSEEYTLDILSNLAKMLEIEIKLAEKSIILASAKGPMYGIIHTIRHLVNTLNWETISLNDNWIKLINNVSNLCLKCEKIVSVIVNASSPEGLIPMDGLCQNNDQVNSQVVLLCAWRTTKEASLILGDIVGIIASKTTNSKLDEILITDIFSCLTMLLSETKHRGAFEQIFVAYSKICSIMWKSPIFHNIPFQYLEDVLKEIKSGTDEKYCATRRSAGMPFIVQALICSNHDKHRVVSLTLDALISMCEVENETGKSKIELVHALNVLRALFRCSNLGEFVDPFISRAINISIILFNSSSWPVRNSSTLLLSALINRVFGVPRSSTEVSWKNCMTGRLFFERYPDLYFTFLKEFKKFSPSDLRPSLYPTLLILARLLPTSNENPDCVFQLSVYIPYIFKCAQSPVMKTRMLAATSIVPQITLNKFVEYISTIINTLINSKLNENFVHGLFLQILSLVKKLPDLLQEDINKLLIICELFLSKYYIFNHYSYVIKEVLVMCITYTWIQLDNLHYSCVNDIYNYTLKSIVTVFHSKVIGRSKYLESSILFLFSICVKAQLDFSEVIIKLMTNKVCYEKMYKILEVILVPSSNEVCDILKEIKKHKNWNEKILFDQFAANNSFADLLCKQCIEVDNLIHIKYTVLSNYSVASCLYFTKYESVTNFMSRAYDFRRDDELAQALFCINNQIRVNKIKKSCEFKKLIELLEYVFLSKKSDNCKCASIDIMVDNYDFFVNESQSNIKILLKLWTMLIRYSEDDSEEVRDCVWRLVDKTVIGSKAFELLFEKFSCLFNKHATSVLVSLICWAYIDIELPQDRYTEQAFDGEDTCKYKEHSVRKNLAIGTVNKLTNNQNEFMNLKINEEIKEWMFETWTNNTEFHQAIIKFSTIKDLINYAKDFNSNVNNFLEIKCIFQLTNRKNCL